MDASTYISIEGVVGVGKSTVIDLLANDFFFPSHGEKILKEPLGLYQTFKHYNPLLEMYRDPKSNAAITQFHIIDAAFEHYSAAVRDKAPIIITERCQKSACVFIEANRRLGNLSDFAADFLLNYSDKKTVENPEVCIYLKCSPTVACQRVAFRKRKEESEADNLLSLQEALDDCYASNSFFKENMITIEVSETDTPIVVAKKVYREIFDYMC